MSATHSDPFGWVGQTIDGKFRIDEVVGEGGFGVVYRAHHLGLGESVAVKCLKIPSTLPAADRDRFHQSFLEEGRILRKLSRHTAAVVQALDVGAATAPNGAWTPYLVLEWLRGQSLEGHLQERKRSGNAAIPLTEAVALLEPAADAIATAHEEGIAHRDVKPANFFTTDVDGVPTMKVLDFGIAKVIAENATITRAFEQTGNAPSLFTPYYGAPEQFNRRFGATGPWTDVFALALVLVEMISGKSALEGDDVTQLYIAATDIGIRPTPRSRGVRTSNAVEDVFKKALAVEPKARYSSMRAFWKELHEALLEPVDDESVGPDAPLPPTITAPSPNSPTGQGLDMRTPTGASARRSLLGATLALTIIGIFVGASFIIRERASFDSIATANRIGAEWQPQVPTQPQSPQEMLLIPAGSFIMGNEKEGPSEKPAHTVVISKPFYIDRLEVTADDYQKCVQQRKCYPAAVHGPSETEANIAKYAALCTTTGRKPINCIDYAQAEGYCSFAGKRLPTEAEWEYAARGADERLYPWGNDAPTCAMGNFARNVGECGNRPRGPFDVGSFPDYASPFGALDMAGNVWEWVADAYNPNAYTKTSRTDPLIPKGEKGILRGGSWNFASSVAKATFRLAYDRRMGHVGTGVRCAKNAN